MNLTTLDKAALEARRDELESSYEALKAAGLALDLTRGKPSAEQLDLSNAMDGIPGGEFRLQDGTDVRNYGGLLGIPEARALGAAIMGALPAEVMAGGNSSLNLMFHYVAHMMPTWLETSEDIRFLCPVPGYDRHFTICEHLGIEMLTVPLNADGPDMDIIEKMASEDPAIKGIWCVPKYSNPTGDTYSEAVVKRFANLGTVAGEHFRIFWDNAYSVHHLADTPDVLADLLPLAKEAGTADSVVMFASTSKVTFAGAGVAFLGTSADNLAAFERYMAAQAIGFDKVNQLRHVRFLRDMEGVAEHMAKHRAIVEPRFNCVQEKLAPLKDAGIATWTAPNGGYFISLDTLPGLATEVVSMAGDAGVKLTPAGATFPYGEDPENTNIRIAPTFPSMEELAKAMDAFVVCLELASVRQLLTNK